jgi:hypothetical protein
MSSFLEGHQKLTKYGKKERPYLAGKPEKGGGLLRPCCGFTYPLEVDDKHFERLGLALQPVETIPLLPNTPPNLNTTTGYPTELLCYLSQAGH